MGKRSKFCKIGNTRKNYGNSLKVKKDKIKSLINIANKMNQTILNNKAKSKDDSSDFSEENQSVKLNKTKNLNTTMANFDRTNLYDSLIELKNNSDKINLTQLNQTFLQYAQKNNLNQTKLHHTIADFALKPGDTLMRNRRVKKSTVLSKGQRKRLEKKEKILKKKLLDEVMRKDKSLIMNNKSVINTTKINKTELNTTNMVVDSNASEKINPNNKKSEFDLMEMNSTLNNLLKDIKNQDENIQLENNNNELNKRKKQNVKKLLVKEKSKIRQVINNANFINNPLDSLKQHIKTTQMLKDRQKKIEENYQKNYNFLNIK